MTADTQLTERRGAVARAAVDRLYQETPRLDERYGRGGRAKCVQDTEYTVQHLADALWADDPRLFLDYVEWANATMIAYGVDAADIRRSIELLREVIPDHLDGEGAERAVDVLDRALEALPGMPACPECDLDALPGEPAAISTDRPGLVSLPVLARGYLDALLAGDRSRADRLVCDEVARGRHLRDIYVHVVAPVQREVGRLWQTRQISVAREHFCTDAIGRLMGRLSLDLLYRERPRCGLVLFTAAVAGEQHELGLRTVADLFEAEGWTTASAGANTPCADLAAEVARVRPHAVALGATMTFHLRRVAEAVRAIRSTPAGRHVRILVGGRSFKAGEHLCARVGGDCRPTDAADALEAVKDLRGGR